MAPKFQYALTDKMRLLFRLLPTASPLFLILNFRYTYQQDALQLSEDSLVFGRPLSSNATSSPSTAVPIGSAFARAAKTCGNFFEKSF